MIARRIATLASALTLTISVGVIVTAQPAAAVLCNSNAAIISKANGKHVSAELGYGGAFYGLLRARASSVGPWERFTLCDYTTYVTLKSNANGKYVHVSTLSESGGSLAYMLRASSSTVGINEKFNKIMYVAPSNAFYLQSFANQNYVSAELGEAGSTYAMLRSRATAKGPWEIFSVYTP